MTKLEHTQKVDTEGGLGATASGQRKIRFASGRWVKTQAPGDRVGRREHQGRGLGAGGTGFLAGVGERNIPGGKALRAGNTGDDGAAGNTRHLDRRARQQPWPALSTLDPAGPRDPSAGRQAKRESARARPLGPGKAARPKVFLPVQAEGAAPLVEQAEQQKRGPGQRGISRRQVLAEGRHGPASASQPGMEPRRRRQPLVQEARGRLGGEERAEGGRCRQRRTCTSGPPPAARRRVVRAPQPTTDFSSAGACTGAAAAGTVLGRSLRTRRPPQGHQGCRRRDAADRLSGACQFSRASMLPLPHPHPSKLSQELEEQAYPAPGAQCDLPLRLTPLPPHREGPLPPS